MTTDSFEWIWTKTLEQLGEAGGAPAPELKGLTAELYVEACKRPASPEKLDLALTRLLRFLATDIERSRANSRVVSNFLMSGDDCWEEDWGELPQAYVEVLGIMGHEMAEAAEDPEWAKEFGGTPEQLLEQLKISYEDGQ